MYTLKNKKKIKIYLYIYSYTHYYFLYPNIIRSTVPGIKFTFNKNKLWFFPNVFEMKQWHILIKLNLL